MQERTAESASGLSETVARRKRWSPLAMALVILGVAALLSAVGYLGLIFGWYFTSESREPAMVQEINPELEGVDKEKLAIRLAAVPYWEISSSFPLPLRQLPKEVAQQGRISPDGRYLSALTNRRLLIFDLPKREQIHELYANWTPGAFSPDSKTLAFIEDRQLIFLDIASGQKRQAKQALQPIFNSVETLAFSGDGRTLALGGGYYVNSKPFARVALYDVPNGTFTRTMDVAGDYIYSLALSSDGKKLLAVGDAGFDSESKRPASAATLMDLTTDQQMDLSDRAQPGRWRGAAIAPDGSKAAAVYAIGRDFRPLLRIWDATTGQAVAEIAGMGTLPQQSGLVMSPDSQRLLVPVFHGWDNNVSANIAMIVDLEFGQPAGVLWKDGGIPLALGFAPDGQTIISVHQDGTVQQWQPPKEDNDKELRTK